MQHIGASVLNILDANHELVAFHVHVQQALEAAHSSELALGVAADRYVRQVVVVGHRAAFVKGLG